MQAEVVAQNYKLSCLAEQCVPGVPTVGVPHVVGVGLVDTPVYHWSVMSDQLGMRTCRGMNVATLAIMIRPQQVLTNVHSATDHFQLKELASYIIAQQAL